jgi:hypothetical protein
VNGVAIGQGCVRRRDGPVRAVHILHQDREFVPAEAGQGVRGPGGLLQAVGHDHEQSVAGDVSEGLVHQFEAIDVHVDDRESWFGRVGHDLWPAPGGL